MHCPSISHRPPPYAVLIVSRAELKWKMQSLILRNSRLIQRDRVNVQKGHIDIYNTIEININLTPRIHRIIKSSKNGITWMEQGYSKKVSQRSLTINTLVVFESNPTKISLQFGLYTHIQTHCIMCLKKFGKLS